MGTCCVYAITHTDSGKRYVGSTVDYEQRTRVHKMNLRHGNHHSLLLQRSFNKYHESAFEFGILEVVSSGELVVREQHWIDQLLPVFNASLTVHRHALGKKLSAEHKAKIRERTAEL